jgi:hypothetical protein
LRARQSNVSYNLLPPEVQQADAASDDDGPADRRPARPSSRMQPRTLFNTAGPFGGSFGGLGGPRHLAIGPDAYAPPIINDDSSDDEAPPRPSGLGFGMPPTPVVPQTHNAEGFGGGPAHHGRINKAELADVSPLGVPAELGFNVVGGLDDHINKLKEMVMLPLMYPELYAKWKVPPPRGVLFHGPPGTGKTLLARALASSVSIGDKKVTFYMRKGADALSKWVGEAERQLRLLFEEAKKNQPAIIFFDEFDGKIYHLAVTVASANLA